MILEAEVKMYLEHFINCHSFSAILNNEVGLFQVKRSPFSLAQSFSWVIINWPIVSLATDWCALVLDIVRSGQLLFLGLAYVWSDVCSV